MFVAFHVIHYHAKRSLSPPPPPPNLPHTHTHTHKRTHTFSKLEDYFSGSIFTIKQYDLFIAQVFFTDYTTRKANEMASEWSCKNQNSGFWGNRHQGKGHFGSS